MITGEQIRRARATLRLDQGQFAALTHLTVGTVRRMERTPGPIVSASAIVEALRIALDDAGIEFIEAGSCEGTGGPGLRFKGQPVMADDVIDFEEAVGGIQEREAFVPNAC